jgi:hypothetical protein
MSGLTFTRATKKQSLLRLALEGPAGYGKTYTALVIGTGLAGAEGKRLAFLDTEFGSAAKYADLFDFDTISLNPPFHPDRAVEAIKAAADGGYGAIVLDSLSHFWMGEGGTLDLVDEVARTKYKNDTHRAWKDAGEIQQRLTDAILRAPIHVIAAMRTKKDYVREEVDGKTKIRAAGTKTVQRDEFDYEFDVIGRFDTPTVMAIVKSRYADLPPETVIEKPGAPFVDGLIRFLGEGEPVAEAAKQKLLDKLLADLATADPSRDWPDVAEKWARREYGHGRELLTESEMAKALAEFGAFLIKLTKPESEPAPADTEAVADDGSAFRIPEGAQA